MGELSTARAARANEVTATNASGKFVASTNETDDAGWFIEPARGLLGSDPGLALHYLTGEPESTCRRIFRGNWPSLYLYRKLLRGKQGETWLNVLMDGCDAQWWLDHLSLAKRIEFSERKLAAISAVLAQQLSSSDGKHGPKAQVLVNR